MAKPKNLRNGYGDLDSIGKIPMSELREKWKEYEGTRLAESVNKPIFLTSSIKEKYRQKEENQGGKCV